LVDVAEDEVQDNEGEHSQSIKDEQVLGRAVQCHTERDLGDAEESNSSAEPLVQLTTVSVSWNRVEKDTYAHHQLKRNLPA